MEQIIPLPEAEDYQIQIRQKKQEEREASQRKRADNTLGVLVSQGVLRPGARLELIRPPRVGLTIPDKAKHATFEDTGHKGIRWDFDNDGYSLSRLCVELCRIGGLTDEGPFAGPKYWALEGEKQSLADRAAALSQNSTPHVSTAGQQPGQQ